MSGLFFSRLGGRPISRLGQGNLDQSIHRHCPVPVTGFFSIGVDRFDQTRTVGPEINLGPLVVVVRWFSFFRWHEIKHTELPDPLSTHLIRTQSFIVT